MSRLLRVELPRHLQAFERYYALGEKRTYMQVATEVGVDANTVKLWGRSFRWQERVQARDLEVARRMADRTLSSTLDDHTKRRRMVELALAKIIKAIAENRVRFQASDLERILRLLESYERWAQENPRPGHCSPEVLVEFLRAFTAKTLSDARQIILAEMAQEFPEYTAERCAPGYAGGAKVEQDATFALLDTTLAERGM